MFRTRKLLLALAAITGALALALPVVSGSAATAPPSTLCVLLQQQLLFAQQTGNPTLAQLLTRTLALQC
ncbi:MAG: hypothetical protein JWO17_421 [Actinomycetia bacterium]|nr:hypothetical protein [Actinomycetes bacterium]